MLYCEGAPFPAHSPAHISTDNAHTRPHHRERVGVQDVRGAGTGDANEYKRRHAHSPALLMSLSIQALTAQTCVPTTESGYGYASAITSIANKS